MSNSSAAPTTASLLATFAPIFERIQEGQRAREQARSLPFEEIDWLKKARFGALRVPQEYGGFGASIVQLTELWIALGTADSNLMQALRGHFTFVEEVLNRPHSDTRERWLKRFANGELVGNGWTETGAAKLGRLETKVTRDGEHWRLDGAKYYSTGSIFADWMDVTAEDAASGEQVIALVNTHQPHIERSDDWDGFGQRTTGTGSSVFTAAHVERDDVTPFSERFGYQTAFYQLNLIAALVGVGHAIERDVAHEVAQRTRVYSHGNADRSADDAQVLQVVGKISAQIFAAHASALKAAEYQQQAFELRDSNDEQRAQAYWHAELGSAQAQVVAADQVLAAATALFNALGASAVRAGKQLDRHWRNARTLASHNPLIYKERIIGDWVVNQRQPDPYQWSVGEGNGV
ncbi:putative FMNH2-dependent monooxygenase SfnC [Carnimonas sp. R-84981]|uniref:acyl-CoA dehydrogenase family protein n=1 Tax=Carnimonas bestiolae TaxID=3402172 RepID=UPI003EDC58E6